MTEAVAYVSGRSEVLCAAWCLGAMLLARRAMATGSIGAAAGAALAGLLALATKEVAVALPILVLGYDWLMRPGDDEARRRRVWSVFVPLFLLMFLAALYRAGSLPADPATAQAPLLNALTQATVIWRYLALFAWPAGQAIMHEVPRVTTPADATALAAALGLAAIAIAAVTQRRRRPLVTFGVLWYLAVLAPSSSVIALREVMAEHRTYLANAGLVMGLAAFVPGAVAAARAGRRSRALAVAGTLVLAALAVQTLRRNDVWSSPVALWREASVGAPGMWEPRYALADALRESGDCAAAIDPYREVTAMRPGHRDAHTNLGICLAQTGQFAEAETAFTRALEIDPAFARGYTNLGALALTVGDAATARDYYEEALVHDPRNVLARMQLASLYERTFGDHHRAARLCGEVRLLAPYTPGVVECVERNQRLAAAKDAGR
jgi:Tfp pilus assembly protein PilF